MNDTHVNESILSEEILEDQKKNRIDHMTYLPGMEDIGSEIMDQVISAMEEYDYSNKKRLNRTGLWDFIRSRHHKRSKKTYDFKRAYLLSVTQTGQGSQRSCGRIARDYFY